MLSEATEASLCATQFPLRPCAGEAFRQIGVCRNVPSGAYFEHFGVFPVPVAALLTPTDARLLDLPCGCVLFGSYDSMGILTGRAEWRVYCCHRQGGDSLSGLARAAVLRALFARAVEGTRYDALFPGFRRDLSRLGTRYLYYVSSVHVFGVHLIYFTNFMGVQGVHLDRVRYLVTQDLYLGDGLDDRCLILVCRSCPGPTAEEAEACVRRVREFVTRFLACLPWECPYYCGIFSGRDRMIERVMRGETVWTRVSNCWSFGDVRGIRGGDPRVAGGAAIVAAAGARPLVRRRLRRRRL